jgi:hypothetical protein
MTGNAPWRIAGVQQCTAAHVSREEEGNIGGGAASCAAREPATMTSAAGYGFRVRVLRTSQNAAMKGL